MEHTKEVINRETGEILTVNNNFVQLYKDNIDLLIEIGSNNKMALNVFLWICKNMDSRNALLVSQSALAEVFGVTERTISSALNYLKSVNAMRIFKSGTSNIYALNSEIVWQKGDNEKQYAYFTAKVYITKSEQDNYKSNLLGTVIKKKSKNSKIKVKDKDLIKNFEEKQNIKTFPEA